MILLQPYRHIAWDFDDTLMGHPASSAMWDYIRTNPLGQTHSIITMRSHGMQKAMLPLLEKLGSGLTRDHFEHILNVPDDLFANHAFQNHFVLDVTDHPYRYWKGKTCSEIGAEVLVDDMESSNMSTAGCLRHNIVHIHPDRFLS